MRTRQYNRALRPTIALALGSFLLVSSWRSARAQQEGKMDSIDRGRVEIMFGLLQEALKKNYYDPTFHGVDMDSRYKVYAERAKNSTTLGEAFRTIAAYLAVLDDSHTLFMPPQYAFHFEYGYRMQMVGDQCLITQVRAGSDAAGKLHPGDQVLSLDGYAVNRKDLWQLEYYLRALAPKPVSNFTLRAPSGAERRELVKTAFGRTQRIIRVTPGDMQDEHEKWKHQMKGRFAELGDALVWRMQFFSPDEREIDRLIGLAHKRSVLILDLRGNSGGALETLRYAVSSLFDHSVHIATNVTRKGRTELEVKSRGKEIFAGKLYVLVDAQSASAAEVLARVVQLEHRGTVVGDRSAGSVMEANIYPMPVGGPSLPIGFAIEITVADWIMSDGQRLEKIGVTPDVLVLPTGSDLAAGRDPALAKAAELAGIKLDPVAAGKLFPFEWPPE